VLALLVCLLLDTACGKNSPVGSTVLMNERFTLAAGQAAVVEGADLRLQFVDVAGDSRCPADVVCILGGDATVRVRASDGGNPAVGYELHTGDLSRASVVHRDVRITLVELQPYPFSSRTIAPDEYRATFTVTSR